MKSLALIVTWLLLVILGFAGWVMNIVSIVHSDGGMTGMFIVRCIGILVAPLGAVLGYI